MTAVTDSGAALRAAGVDPEAVRLLVRAVLAEDLGDGGDITSELTVPADAVLEVRYVARQPGVVCGLAALPVLVEEVLGAAELDVVAADGARVGPGDVLARLRGPARGVLTLERSSLNLLGHLSGVATLTRSWADAIAGTPARVRDTRKTMPMLRALEKYAVRCGGGVNHRVGLYDGVLVKDNHVTAAGGVGAAVDAVLAARGRVRSIQIEVDDLDQLDDALAHGAPELLLDNFDLDELREGVRRVRERAPHVRIEASGGLTLDRAAAVAATGVDYLAVGALTHSAPSLDIGLDS
ncbi:carboxylating nicotinate-nucleotide diphosphorylase [Jatrophihabitans endophyticus]|uniref:carboxylating nicotinate-nucleotide diphosphorylase n=1 Tax=Jatrophihabitans endophyticus TaxID=1206085 RepID=UPI0019E77622|nr:carboxylating nicotinate-nucleotide diphosphorylase [Jatrophihabitans endophyticus]MBE7189204.1 carboxylating nicotinate-nucleotide diphosphorylase [Jatrophihabitans endophyticus]